MPIPLEFKPHNQEMTYDKSIVEELHNLIFHMPFLACTGTKMSVYERGNKLDTVQIVIEGMCVIDRRSAKMLRFMLADKLRDVESPFYLSGSGYQENLVPGEAAFLYERFRPSRSRNARLVSTIPATEIPEEYICSLSGDVMDEPVFDIRSPGTIYDQNFLMYWLNQSEPRVMPHTNLPFYSCFLKTRYDLKSKIDFFVQNVQIELDNKKLEELLTKCKLDKNSRDIKVMNKALRRCAANGTHEELSLLLKFGVNINSQDDVPEKRFTALHIALDRNNIDHARTLMYCGARIDIKDAHNKTAYDKINALANPDDRKDLLFACRTLKIMPPLVTSSPTSRPGMFAQSLQPEDSGDAQADVPLNNQCK